MKMKDDLSHRKEHLIKTQTVAWRSNIQYFQKIQSKTVNVFWRGDYDSHFKSQINPRCWNEKMIGAQIKEPEIPNLFLLMDANGRLFINLHKWIQSPWITENTLKSLWLATKFNELCHQCLMKAPLPKTGEEVRWYGQIKDNSIKAARKYSSCGNKMGSTTKCVSLHTSVGTCVSSQTHTHAPRW